MDFVFLILWVCLGSSEDDESGFTTCHFKFTGGIGERLKSSLSFQVELEEGFKLSTISLLEFVIQFCSNPLLILIHCI